MSVGRIVRWVARPRQVETALRFDRDDFDPPVETRLLILQPTPFCNIDCDYCYLPHRSDRSRMSIETVRQAAERLRDDGLAGANLTVVWHAGEPLVAPPAFYEEAFGVLQAALGAHTRVSHSIQTNATLVDDAWCALFKRHAVRIGVSVDGPARLHDAHRRTRAGGGTHALVLRGMERLRAHGIGFHAIAVVTAQTLAEADAFVDFFLEQGVQELGCNFDEAEGAHPVSSLALHEQAHAAFLARLLIRAEQSGGRLRVRELSNAFRLIADASPTYRWRGRSWPDNPQVVPFALISIAANGDFSSFSPELLGQSSLDYQNFVLGNVSQQGFLAAAPTERFRRLWHDVLRGTEACRACCAHFDICGGGAPANKLYENADLSSTETLYCRSMVKRPFDLVLRHLERTHAIAADFSMD